MSTLTYLKYTVLNILEALHLYEFPVKGTQRIIETLDALTDTIEQLHIGADEADGEAVDITETIAELNEEREHLIIEARRAFKVKNILLTLMGE